MRMKCKFCGITLKQLMFYGLFDLFGARVSPDPMYCPDSPNHKHELIQEEASNPKAAQEDTA